MSKRSIYISARLSEEEAKAFSKQCAMSGLSISDFIRRAIAGVRIRARPVQEYLELRTQIRIIERDINQIVQNAHVAGNISHAELAEIQKSQRRIESLLREIQ